MSRRLHAPPTRVVAEIRRPALGEVIRVSLLGAPPTHADVRSFTATPASRGEPRPTRSGLCIGLKQLPDLIRALLQAEEATR